MTSDRLSSSAIALAWGACVSVAAYGIVRGIQFFLYPDPNPATLVWSAHAGFFWRCWTCGYAGALAAFIAFVVAPRGPSSGRWPSQAPSSRCRPLCSPDARRSEVAADQHGLGLERDPEAVAYAVTNGTRGRQDLGGRGPSAVDDRKGVLA